MKTAKRFLLATLAAFAATLPTAALADFKGTAGKIVGIEHNDDASDDAAIVTGSLFIEENDGTPGSYRFGGGLCPGRDLSIEQQALLLDALRSKLIVQPYYKVGNGATRCLTSFLLVAKKSYAVTLAK